MDYDIGSALKVLENVKENPYGAKFTDHLIFRLSDRSVNMDLIYKTINQETPVGIEKEANTSTRFLVIYEYTKYKDLAIGIDILNENEIMINCNR